MDSILTIDVYFVIHYLIPLVDKLASQSRDFSLGRDAFCLANYFKCLKDK